MASAERCVWACGVSLTSGRRPLALSSGHRCGVSLDCAARPRWRASVPQLPLVAPRRLLLGATARRRASRERF